MAKKKNEPKVFLLTKYEQYLINNHEYRIIAEDQLLKGFIANVIIPRLQIDLSKHSVTWNTAKGELYTTPIEVTTEEQNESEASEDRSDKSVGQKSKGNKGK